MDKNEIFLRENIYKKRAKNPKAWFSNGEINQYIANLLYSKYKSHYRKFFKTEGGNLKLKKNEHFNGELHRFILMFFGIALESYLKGLLIKDKKINPLKNNSAKLNKKEMHHYVLEYYTKAFGEPKNTEGEILKNLEIAIMAGKYHIPIKINYKSLTYNLDKKIEITKKIIKKVKKSFNEEMHFGIHY